MNFKRFIFWLIFLTPAVRSTAAETPRGSITIDRIADIKFPTAPAWSPDGKMVAFLWDAAGKQDLFAVTPGQKPLALTDFAVDPDTLLSNIGSIAWISPDRILFAKDGQLWSVSSSSPNPSRFPGFDNVGAFDLTSDRTQMAFIRGGQLWTGSLAAKTQRQLTFLTAPLAASAPAVSRDGKAIAFIASYSRVVPVPAEDMRYNGERILQLRNQTTDRKLGIVTVFGGEPIWIPTMGEPTAVQWTADGSVLFQEVSPERKVREIKVATTSGAVRTLWKDTDPAWWSPTSSNEI